MIRLLVISGLVLSAFAHASPSIDDANRAFAAGDYKAAASGYESLLEENGPSASIYYNLGNTRQKTGQTGPAILAYERARLLSPRDPDILANLALARKEAAIFEHPSIHPRVHAATRKLSRNEWSWLLTGSAVFLGLLSLTRGILPVRKPWMRPATVSTSIIAIVLAGLSSSALYLRRDDGRQAVIIARDAAVRLSPFDTAESLGTPTPGRIVLLGKKNGGYQFITVPASRLEGWIASHQIQRIETSEP